MNGAWSSWSDGSGCSASCRGGTVTKHRTCTNPAPAHGGASCLGDDTDVIPCNNIECECMLENKNNKTDLTIIDTHC